MGARCSKKRYAQLRAAVQAVLTATPPAHQPAHPLWLVKCVAKALAPVAEVAADDEEVGGVGQVGGQQPAIRRLCRGRGRGRGQGGGRQWGDRASRLVGLMSATRQAGREAGAGEVMAPAALWCPQSSQQRRQVGSQPAASAPSTHPPAQPPTGTHPPTRLWADGSHHDGHQGEGLPRHDVQDVGQVQLQAVLRLIRLSTHLPELSSGPQLGIHLGIHRRAACSGWEWAGGSSIRLWLSRQEQEQRRAGAELSGGRSRAAELATHPPTHPKALRMHRQATAGSAWSRSGGRGLAGTLAACSHCAVAAGTGESRGQGRGACSTG